MDYQDYYEENGYVIFPDLIPGKKIDLLLDALSKFKKSRYPYYSQSIHNWIQPQIDSSGFMVESMENFTKLHLNCGLRKTGNDILLGKEIYDALKTINPNFDNFVQWQNMLFDRSTGTVDHYDSWYLDTYPAGFLTAAWVALEDIDEKSGPFRIFPKSHKDFSRNKLNNASHEDFVTKCAEYSESHEHKLALLKKGSVLFWHPSLIHWGFESTRFELLEEVSNLALLSLGSFEKRVRNVRSRRYSQENSGENLQSLAAPGENKRMLHLQRSYQNESCEVQHGAVAVRKK